MVRGPWSDGVTAFDASAPWRESDRKADDATKVGWLIGALEAIRDNDPSPQATATARAVLDRYHAASTSAPQTATNVGLRDARKGAGGVCGKHGLYEGIVCPSCLAERPAVRTLREPERGPVTMETVAHLHKMGHHQLAEIARGYAVDRPRWWHRFTRRGPENSQAKPQ